MPASANPRLDNLLASLSLNLAEEAQSALERASGLTGSAVMALLALEEFLSGAHVGRIADVLGLTHSGAVRLVTQLERAGLAERYEGGGDRRRVEVRLTAGGRRRAHTARTARDDVIASATLALTIEEGRTLEALLDKLVAAQVSDRIARRRVGQGGPWWCRTCSFIACDRAGGHCPAQVTAGPVFARASEPSPPR